MDSIIDIDAARPWKHCEELQWKSEDLIQKLPYSCPGAYPMSNFGGHTRGGIVSWTAPGFSKPHVSNVTYNAAGQVTGLIQGGTGSGYSVQVTTANQYNNRLQPTVLSASVPSGTIFSHTLCYSPNCGSSTTNNGNIFEDVDNLQAANTAAFGYDTLNRLTSAQAQNWGDSYTYDPFGNLYQKTPIGNGVGETLQATPTAQNQLSGIGLVYDANGNVITDNLGTHYTYDAENRVATAGSWSYTYDGDGNRVLKSAGGNTGSTYWYGEDGTLSDEQSVALNPGNGWPGELNRMFYLNGHLMETTGVPANTIAGDYFLLYDQIGSNRVTVDTSTGQIHYTNYYPFGGYVNPPTDVLEQRFTGKERDVESGNDYFRARYNSSAMGRFLSPDPSMDSVALRNPQTWNRYAYTVNNPLRFIDPTGMCWVAAPSGVGTYDWMDRGNQGQTCYNAIATSNGSTLTMYGSNDAKDITKLTGNDHGMIDLQDISAQHDAGIDVKEGEYTYVNAGTGADLFNFLQDYQSNYPDAPNLYITEAGAWDGSSVSGHQSHKDGMQIDLRYIDDNGKPIQGKEAYNSADADRMWDMMRMAHNSGLTQIYAGDETEWGDYSSRPKTSPHEDHWHISIPNPPIPNPVPPRR